MPRGTRCVAHCSRCGCHFTGVAAYDAHRRGKFRPKPGERPRHCVAPEDAVDVNGKDLFIVITESGVCDLDHGSVRRGVTVWTVRESYERAHDVWNKDEEPEPEQIQVRRRGGGSRRKRRRLEDVR